MTSRDDTIRELRRQGVPVTRIAAQVGCSPSTVRRTLRPGPNRPKTRRPLTLIGPARERLQALKAAGVRWREISRLTGIEESSLSAIADPVRQVGRTRKHKITVGFSDAILAISVDQAPAIIAARPKILRPHPRRYDYVHIRELAAKGLTNRQICDRIGCSRETIRAARLEGQGAA